MSALLMTIAERVEGTRRILATEGWEFVVCVDEFGDEEPRISDEQLAANLGMEVRHLRELSGRHEEAGHLTPRVCRTVRQTGGRPGMQRFYSEADALFLVTRSERDEAIALTKGMIQVVLAVRRHLAGTVPVIARARRAPKAKALPASPRVMELAGCLAERTGATTDEVLGMVLDRWASENEELRRAAGFGGTGKAVRGLLVFVESGTYDALAASILADGLTPSVSSVSVIASDVLTGHSYLQRAFCGLGSRGRVGPNWLTGKVAR